jgi:CheY-like chemotaxis protein
MTPSKRILLAEDDGDDQEFFNDFLRQRPDVTLVSTVTNGEEVIAYLENAADETAMPDAIILDQNMPRMSGLQTLQQLKGGKYAHIPVMVYSTYADEHLVRMSIRFGAALVKGKPETMEEYHDMVNELISLL